MAKENDYLIQRKDNMFKADALIRCTEDHAWKVARKISNDHGTRCDIFRVVITEHLGLTRPEAPA